MRPPLWMKFAGRISAVALAASAPAWAAAQQGNGLAPAADAGVFSRWQARVSLSQSPTVWRSPSASFDGQGFQSRSLSLMGDYFFGGGSNAGLQPRGFRATSGLLLGARSSFVLLDSGAVGSTGRGRSGTADGTGLNRRPSLPGGEPLVDTAAVPYFGVGYSDSSLKGGWGFSADLGLVARNASSAVNLGRALGGTQNLDDMLRDMRLSPLLQLGVSYSF